MACELEIKQKWYEDSNDNLYYIDYPRINSGCVEIVATVTSDLTIGDLYMECGNVVSIFSKDEHGNPTKATTEAKKALDHHLDSCGVCVVCDESHSIWHKSANA